ncbi:hypothetical protein [Nocardioides sp. SYSU DS0663]|uniref:hypothetical protein n=1 Tax=Nocardioides sp. SYSU DS0663 TaxID=3416445 RepID=UPI003F4AFAB7
MRRGLTGGRRRGPVAGDDTLWIEASHVAGGPVLVSYVVLTAVADRRFRAALGTPDSLPPAAGPR